MIRIIRLADDDVEDGALDDHALERVRGLAGCVNRVDSNDHAVAEAGVNAYVSAKT